MIPVRLEMKNFLAYRVPGVIYLEGIHLACLTGVNGAGKSSLLDAITWALWGQARSKDNNLVYLGQKEMSVTLDFLHEGSKYRVARYRTVRGSSGSGRLELFAYDTDDALNDISEPSSRETQRRINALLRLDYATFIASAFVQQGQADTFTVMRPAERKKVLANILGLEAWDKYEEAAKERASRHKGEADYHTQRIVEIDHDLASEPYAQQELTDAQAKLADAEQESEAAEALVAALEDAPAALRAAESDRDNQTRRRDEHQRDLDSVRRDIAKRADEIARYEDILANRDEIEAGYAALTEARTVYDSLNEKVRALSDIDKRIASLENDLTAERTRLQSERDGLHRTIAQLGKQTQSADPTKLDMLREQLAEHELAAEQYDTTQATLQALNEEAAALKAEQANARVRMDEIRERMDNLEAVEGAECPLCGQPLTEQHRTDMLAQLHAEGTSYGDTWRANKARLAEIDDQQHNLKGTLKQLATKRSAIPRLQRQVGELETQLKAVDDARRQLADADSQLTQVSTKLESDDYAHTIREALTVAYTERDLLDYDRDAHDEQKRKLKAYNQFEAQHSQLRIAVSTLGPLRDAQDGSYTREERLLAAIADIDAALVTIDAAISEQQARVVEFRERQQRVMKLRTATSQAREKVTIAEQKLKAFAAKREQRVKLDSKRAEAVENAELYAELREAFGKKGVPAMLIESAIPELEEIANTLLGRMTDGRMALRFDTQREKVTGGVIETLDIHIADELGTRPYEMYSGGESFRINFAIRVALSKLLANRAGAHLETLFIDEGFGTQDADGRSKLVEAIHAVKDEFALVLIITHIDELKDMFPVHLHVEKGRDGSTVRIR